MDLYGISALLRQISERFGIGAALGIISILLVMAAIAYVGKQIMAERTKDAESRNQERLALVGEISSARQQMHTLMTNHIAHLSSSQESFSEFQRNIVKVQEAQIRTIDQIGDSVRRLADAQAVNFQHMSEQHQLMSEKLSEIKGHIQ